MKKIGFWNVKNKALASAIAYMSDYEYNVMYDKEGNKYYEFPMNDNVIRCYNIITKEHKRNKDKK